jgi:hypothetical protein
MNELNLPIGEGVHTQGFAQGALVRGDLQKGDFLSGSSLTSLGASLCEVMEVQARGVWLIGVQHTQRALFSAGQMRARGKFFTWGGLAALPAPPGGPFALIRLRLADTIVRPGGRMNEWFLTASGELVTVNGGKWMKMTPSGRPVFCALPVGGEVFALSRELPQ